MNHEQAQPPRGRGSASNPANRFERLAYEPDAEDGPSPVRTQVFLDSSRTVLTDNDSPDLLIRRALNPYRGCEHGCSYCYARPTHEYLGMGSGLDFETKILVKLDAAELLRAELSRKGYAPEVIALSGVTDPYQPIERKLRVTRACLEVLAECRHPVCIITKSALVERDIDLLSALAQRGAAWVNISVTSLDAGLQRALEPRASTPRARLNAIRALTDACVPVGVNVSPVIPGLNDSEIPAILSAAKEAGAIRASWVLLRLPHALKELFESWLDAHAPLRKDRVLNTLREMHGGKLYDPEFGTRLRGRGPRAEQIARLFQVTCSRVGLSRERFELNAGDFRPPQGGQLDLF